LTQVLSDGTNAYLYGNARIGEEQPAGWRYHLGDALGSLRQLADASVNISLTRSYEPFGDPLLTTGTGTSIFAFAGEQRDGTGLVICGLAITRRRRGGSSRGTCGRATPATRCRSMRGCTPMLIPLDTLTPLATALGSVKVKHRKISASRGGLSPMGANSLLIS